MRRNRLIAIILWILSVVGISFFGGPVSYGFFALCTLVPIICLIYLISVYFFFHIYQELDGKHLTANRVTPFSFMLINEYHFGFVSVRVRFYSSFSTIIDLDDGVEYEFLPRTGITRKTGLVCKYRGEYEVGIKTVELTDFFRLFRLSYHNKEARRVVVRPNAVELSGLQSVDLTQAVARDSMNNPTEKDIPVRKYEPGDDLRRVNWKATAKSGELLVHNRIGEEREGVAVILGTNRCSPDPMEYIPVENKMLETSIALTLFFIRKNIPVRSYHLSGGLNDLRVSDLTQFETYYNRISSAVFREEVTDDMLFTEIYKRPEVFRCKTVFLVLREWSEPAGKLVAQLHNNNVFTVVYLIAAEDMTADYAKNLPGAAIRCIPCDADLTEVIG